MEGHTWVLVVMLWASPVEGTLPPSLIHYVYFETYKDCKVAAQRMQDTTKYFPRLGRTNIICMPWTK